MAEDSLDELAALLSPKDYALAEEIAGKQQVQTWAPARLREPDLVIAPDGKPYLYRWHVIPRNGLANVYFHIQVADDPERPLHDHQYDNQSVILSGGYEEVYAPAYWPRLGDSRFAPKEHFLHAQRYREVRERKVVHRRADEAHRLRLLPDVPYAMTLFTTGPRIREWGFWLSQTKWVPWFDVTEGDYREGGVSKWKEQPHD